MNVVTAVFLVALLASSSYAVGRLHGQLSYKIGYRAGYRNGYADGDRAAWLYRRREPLSNDPSGSLTPVGTPPDLPTVAESPPAKAPLLTPEVQRLLTEPPDQDPVRPPDRAPRPDRPVNALPMPAVRPPVNRGVVRQGTTYHAVGVGAVAGGGRHAHPD